MRGCALSAPGCSLEVNQAALWRPNPDSTPPTRSCAIQDTCHIRRPPSDGHWHVKPPKTQTRPPTLGKPTTSKAVLTLIPTTTLTPHYMYLTWLRQSENNILRYKGVGGTGGAQLNKLVDTATPTKTATTGKPISVLNQHWLAYRDQKQN